MVLDPCKITLLSNLKLRQKAWSRGIVQIRNALGWRLSRRFSLLRGIVQKNVALASLRRSFLFCLQKQCRSSRSNYTTLKPFAKFTRCIMSFRPLLNYTTLKRVSRWLSQAWSFRPLLNYATLKPQIWVESVVEGYSSNKKCAWFAFESCFLF